MHRIWGIEGRKSCHTSCYIRTIEFDRFHVQWQLEWADNRTKGKETRISILHLLHYSRRNLLTKTNLSMSFLFIICRQLGEKTILQSIKKAGHLLHVERPCAYNRHLKKFLALVKDEGTEEWSSSDVLYSIISLWTSITIYFYHCIE